MRDDAVGAAEEPPGFAGFALNTDERDLIRSLIVADPALVLDDDQVMRALIGEEAEEGARVVDLRDRLVQRLEARLRSLVAANRSMIAAAYENVAGTRALHRAVIALSGTVTLEDFLRCLTREVPEILAIEEARLCLEADVDRPYPAEGLGQGLEGRVLALPEGSVDDYLRLDAMLTEGDPEAPPEETVVVRTAGIEAELIFGPETAVRSEAMVRLDVAGAVGLVVFGAADPERFGADQGTDLLHFFGAVTERLLSQRLQAAGLEG
ncbi:MAG: DUF484 family protein [Pseudomonadota bacterium]